MEAEAQTFHVRDVLHVVTGGGIMISHRGLDGVLDILFSLTGHTGLGEDEEKLSQAMGVCQAHLLSLFPILSGISSPKDGEDIERWCREQMRKMRTLSDELLITPIQGN